MNLLDAFKVGGLPGLGAAIGAKASPTVSEETAKALFTSQVQKAATGFNISFADKFLFTLVAGTLLVVAVSRAVK